MGDDHPSLETLARWLAGELEHERVVTELAPHFLASCPLCRQMWDEIRRLQEESGHWDEIVAVVETREAPGLLALLAERPHEERMRLAGEDEGFQTWGLCQLLLKESREAVFSDPTRAVELAHLAVRLAGQLNHFYHPDWVLDLRARAWACLGNARRVLGELRAADDAFLRADECLERSTTGNPRILAEVLSLKASLRLDQRQLDVALQLVDQALVLYQSNGDQQGGIRMLLKKVKILNEMGRAQEAIEVLRKANHEAGHNQDTQLLTQARFNLLVWLTLEGQHAEAQTLLPEVEQLFRNTAQRTDWLRLRWTEGSIAHGLGRPEEAEAAYCEVQRSFLEMGKGYDAALVSLDLAALLAEQGRKEELKRLAAEMLVIFESQEVHREAYASFLLLERAVVEERASLEMIRELAAQLRRGRWGGGESQKLPGE